MSRAACFEQGYDAVLNLKAINTHRKTPSRIQSNNTSEDNCLISMDVDEDLERFMRLTSIRSSSPFKEEGSSTSMNRVYDVDSGSESNDDLTHMRSTPSFSSESSLRFMRSVSNVERIPLRNEKKVIPVSLPSAAQQRGITSSSSPQDRNCKNDLFHYKTSDNAPISGRDEWDTLADETSGGDDFVFKQLLIEQEIALCQQRAKKNIVYDSALGQTATSQLRVGDEQHSSTRLTSYDGHSNSSFSHKPSGSDITSNYSLAPQFDVRDEFVEEQKRLLDRIYQEHAIGGHLQYHNELGSSNSTRPYHANQNKQESFAKTSSHEHQGPNDSCPGAYYVHSPVDAKLTLKNNAQDKIVCVELYPGQEVRILDQTQTLNAISKGTAVLTQCAGCPKRLYVAKNAKLLFCPSCGTLTPTHLRVNMVSREKDEDLCLKKY